MPMISVKRLQAAQGIVEFALVLPILLLIIFGIFAFGHLFFSYTSVVSASREAARWGAAAGVSETMRPRYSDCDSIRAAAVRVGSFAGVAAVDSPDENTPGIEVTFDHGPNDPDPPFDDCSDGLGAAVVGYGDRINVRVTVQYRPIVPTSLLNIPTFPLTATTSRTIIKSLPVGEALPVEVSCPTTTIILEPFAVSDVLPELPLLPQVNQPVDVLVRVIASDGSSPHGEVTVSDYDPNDRSDIHVCRVPATSAGVACNILVPEGYQTTGIKYLTADYDNQGTCYQPSQLVNEPFEVAMGNTWTEIISDQPDPSWPYNPDYPETADTARVLVEFLVHPEYPTDPSITGFTVPDGGVVTVSDAAGNVWTSSPIRNGRGSVSVYLSENTNLYASYGGDVYFNASGLSEPEPHTIRIAPTPVPTDLPEHCPYPVGNIVMDNSMYTIRGRLSNANGGETQLQSVSITWPANPTTQLVEMRFGTLDGMGTCNSDTASAGLNCLWQAPDPLNGLPPTTQFLNSGTASWLSAAAFLPAGGEKYLDFKFASDLPEGRYEFSINFSNGCVLAGYADYEP